VAIIGCGAQARYQLEAKAVFLLETVRVFDIDSARAEAFARANSTATCSATPASSVRDAVSDVDICITCTTSKSPILTNDLDLRGCFVAAMGADNPEKQEIAPALMRRARILVDDIEACASGGDLNHALRAGAMSKDQVHAELADLAAGRKRGRMTEDELVIFDSSGSGVQDVAAAWSRIARVVEPASAGDSICREPRWNSEDGRRGGRDYLPAKPCAACVQRPLLRFRSKCLPEAARIVSRLG
jgi:alanine dehydrogenase